MSKIDSDDDDDNNQDDDDNNNNDDDDDEYDGFPHPKGSQTQKISNTKKY